MKHIFFVPVLALVSIACAAPVSGQWGRPDARYGYGSGVDRIAYDNGYREGLTEGEKDGRARDPFRYQDERDFQRADAGYRRQYGNVVQYRQLFRQGFSDGYAEGYRRYNRGYGGYAPYGDPRQGPYRYPAGRDDRSLGAFEVGARDGYEKGREDVRDNDRYDPRRHKWYREGDRDYNDRYGSRDRYRDDYRRGFLAGYERGYREGRYR